MGASCYGQKASVNQGKDLKTSMDVGKQLYWEGKYQSAIEIFRNNIDKNSSNYKAYNFMGLCMMMVGRFQKAKESLEISLKIYRNDALTYNNYGNLLMHQESHIEAEHNFKKSINLDPSNLMTQCNMAYLKIKECRYEEAITILQGQEKGEIFSDSLMGMALIKTKQIQRGQSYFLSVLRHKPKNDFDNMLLGNASYFLGQLDKALAYYEAGMTINPHNYQLYQAKGEVLLKLAKYDEALECINKSLQINSKSSQSYYILGSIYEQKQQSNMARHFYEKATQRNPQNKDAHQSRIRVMKRPKSDVMGIDGNNLIIEIAKKLEMQQQKKLEDQEKKNCIICMQRKADCLSGDCGHVITCFEVCSPKLSICPTCRGPFNPKKVYLN